MGSYIESFFKRPIFSPRPLGHRLEPDVAGSDISSLPDLVRFNARKNPNHIFALQSEISQDESYGKRENSYKASKITFSQLEELIRRCAGWLRSTVTSARQNGDSDTPVALYLESDIGLFIHLVALLSIDVPVFIILLLRYRIC